MVSSTLLLLLLIVFFFNSDGVLIIELPHSLNGSYRSSQLWFPNSKAMTTNITASIVDYRDSDNINGNIVLLPTSDRTSTTDIIINLQRCGCAAILLPSTREVPGSAMYQMLGEISDIRTSVFQIDAKLFMELLNDTPNVTGCITNNDNDNEWKLFYESNIYMVYWCLQVGFTFLSMCFVTYVQVEMYVRVGWKITYAQVALYLIMTSEILTLLKLALTYQLETRRYLPYTAIAFLHYFPVSTLVCSSLLILLFWFELINSRKLQVISFPQEYNKFFLVSVVILLVGNIGSVLVLHFFFTSWSLTIAIIVEIVFLLSSTVLTIVVFRKIYFHIERRSDVAPGTLIQHLMRVSQIMLVSSLLWIVLVVLTCIILIPSVEGKPIANSSTNLLIQIGLRFVSFSLAFIILPRSSRNPSDDTSTENQTDQQKSPA
eukprot:TRINITY_DN561_c1_g1_i3.p1 TRINITY_DN561_c1_g1~~TRINITY_DN561_c1_g1_i3.p1  ORF type:complete len:431 (-),score=4.99 TRINITY_DN561_c1_g1_i3:105-1397(-)